MVTEDEDKNSILETLDLSVGYRKKRSLLTLASGINLRVKKGELVAFIGQNGIGKSTLLKTISGLQPALTGSILLEGKDRNQLSDRELARKISVVLTGQPFSKNLSVEELVALGRQPYTNWLGSFGPQDREATFRALDLVNIRNLSQRKCYELSDGQLQKVLIARALGQDTPIMVLDEPTSHLDLYHKAQVLQLLKGLTQKTKKTILFATHELNLALQLCDRLVVMKEAKVYCGSPEELIATGIFRTLFPDDLISFDPMDKSFRIKS